MAEKKEGFFKRLFRFGKKKREEDVEPDAEALAAEEAAKAAEAAEAEKAASEAEEAARKAEAERQAQEDEAAAAAAAAAAAETERLAKIEAERRAEAERKAEEEKAQQRAAEEAAAAKAEEAAKAAAAAEAAKAAQERAEQEAKAARESAEKKEAEDAAKAAAEEEAARKAEADRLAKEAEAAQAAATAAAEAERQAKEEAERLVAAEREAQLEAERKAAEEEAAKAAEEAAAAEAARAAEAAKAARAADAAKAAEEAKAAEAARQEQERLEAEERAKADSEPDSPPPPPEPQKKKSWFSRLKDGLARSSNQLTENITAVFTKRKLDEDTLQELEDILIQADLGVETALNITDSLASQRMGKDITDEEVREFMAGEIEKVLEPVAAELELDLEHRPHVILVVGVNGSGKTTTIGKLSQKLVDGGFSTMLVAGDTFRAAAIEQLKIWGDRTGSKVVSRELGSDAAGLAFDAYAEAKEVNNDVVLMDTAGRLQNKTELMDELEKIIRVLRKQDESAPHTVLLTLDATTGQNALNQVEIFKDVAGVNGLVMTKLDGTARGGIMVSIAAKFKLPVYFIGVGEQVEDLEPFDAKDFARSIAGLED